MRIQSPKRYTLASILAAITLLAACQPNEPSMNPKEAQFMSEMTKNMSPRCFGRYLIDLPETFVLNSEGGQKVSDVTIEITPRSELEFKSLLNSRKQQLAAAKTYSTPQQPTLKTVTALPNAIGVVFDRAKTPESNVPRTLELLDWKDGHEIRMSIDALDMSYAQRIFPGDIRKTDTTQKLEVLLDVYRRTSIRHDEIPAGQGICIINGFVAGPATQAEEVNFFYHLKTANDVFFNFSTVGGVREPDTLLDRLPDVKSVLAQNGGHIIRTGERKDAIPGQELLYTVPDEKTKRQTHTFVFEDTRRDAGAATPLVRIELNNGLPKPEPERPQKSDDNTEGLGKTATLTEAEALHLWDQVVRTVRPRPAAF